MQSVKGKHKFNQIIWFLSKFFQNNATVNVAQEHVFWNFARSRTERPCLAIKGLLCKSVSPLLPFLPPFPPATHHPAIHPSVHLYLFMAYLLSVYPALK